MAFEAEIHRGREERARIGLGSEYDLRGGREVRSGRGEKWWATTRTSVSTWRKFLSLASRSICLTTLAISDVGTFEIAAAASVVHRRSASGTCVNKRGE
jgi:hypothetical protein